MSKEIPFRVPDQLYDVVDDHVLEVYERWQDYDLRTIREKKPELTTIEFGNREGRIAILEPEGELDESITGVTILPYQQSWTDPMYIRTKLDQEINMPHARFIVLPQNSVREAYYHLTQDELAAMEDAGLEPLYEVFARMINAARPLGKLSVRGDSFGGRCAFGIAASGVLEHDVASIIGDEAPNKDRTEKELRKDFLASGKWSWQRQAIADSGIPSLQQAYSRPRMAVDYARFGVATLSGQNKAINRGMSQPHFNELAKRALYEYPDAEPRVSHAKAGYVEDSKMCDPEIFAAIDRLSLAKYSGDASHAHSTMDNPMASALAKTY